MQQSTTSMQIDAIDIRKCFPTRLVESMGLSQQNRVTFEPKREFQRGRERERHIDTTAKCLKYVQFL